MDVKTAFLNGYLKEEIYMKVPEGISSKNNYVCKLNKAIYGLKQSARCWFEAFEKVLIDYGFKNSPVDRCVYILDKGDIKKNIYVVLYVDDVVIATNSLSVMNAFKEKLASKFEMKDLKDIKLFLGIRITRTGDQICLDQTRYINDILKNYMPNFNATRTPLPEKLDFDGLNSDVRNNHPSQNVLGSLMYLMLCTRPDLSFAINLISRFVNENNDLIWQY